MRETRIWSLGWEDPLVKEVATHSSTLAWRIPWMEEPGRLQSTGSQRVGHDWVTSLSLSLYKLYHDKLLLWLNEFSKMATAIYLVSQALQNPCHTPSKDRLYFPFPWNWLGLCGCLKEQNAAEMALCDFFFFQRKLKVSPLSPALQEEFLRVERSGKLADQYNRIENSDIHTHKYVQLISYKDAKAVQWRNDSFFQQILFNS